MTQIARIESLLHRASAQLQSCSDEALVCAEEARELAQEIGAAEHEIRALCIEAQILFLERRPDDALQLLAQLRDIDTRAATGRMQGTALALEGRIRFANADLDGAIDCWQGCRALPEHRISEADRVLALVGLGQILQWAGRPEEALALHQTARMMAGESGSRHLQHVAQIQIAHDLADLQQYPAAQALLQEILPDQSGNYAFEAEIYELGGEIWLGRGQLDKAQSHLLVALKIYRMLGNLWGQADCLLNLARCHLARAECADALDMLHEVGDIVANFPAPGLRCALLQAMAEAQTQCGNTEAARQAENEYRQLRADLAGLASRITEPE